MRNLPAGEAAGTAKRRLSSRHHNVESASAETDGDNTDGSPAATTRITVALIPRVTVDLQRLQERTNLSKTDLANRAITLYEFIDAQIRAGRDLLVRDAQTGITQLVRLL